MKFPIPTPKRPTGGDLATKFLQWIWDMLALYLRPIDSPTIKWEMTSRGMVAHAKVSQKAAAAVGGGGRFCGPGYDIDGFFPDTVFKQYDSIMYTTIDSATNRKRAIWIFAWGGPEDAVGGFDTLGPVEELRNNSTLPILPTTDGKWFLVSYTAIDDTGGSSALVPNSAAQAQLLDNYPNQ